MNAYSKSDSLKVVPQNVEMEQALLGAVLTNNDAFYSISKFLKPEHFFEQIHQMIYQVISDMVQEGKRANPITVKTYLPQEKIGDMSIGLYLARLVGEATTILNAPDYARGVFELYLKRQIISLCESVSDTLYTAGNDIPVPKLCSEIYQEISNIDGLAKEGKGTSAYGDLLSRAIDAIQKENNEGEDSRIGWCLPEMQEVAGYMRPGNLIGLMSDSGGGKTSISLQQARYSADLGFKTAFFSIEVTEEEAAIQAACQKLQIPMETMDAMELTDAQQSALMDEIDNKLPFRIVGFSDCDLQGIRSQCMALKRQWGLDLVVIDHAKLINLPGKPTEMFAERVNNLYRGLKRIAKEVDIAIIILIQRNDGWKKRSSPRPMEGDAYGGGGVKQNLDIWFSLYRPEVFTDHFQQQIKEAKKQEEKDRIAVQIENAKGKAWFINHKRRRGAPNKSRHVIFKAQTVTFKSEEQYEPTFGGI